MLEVISADLAFDASKNDISKRHSHRPGGVSFFRNGREAAARPGARKRIQKFFVGLTA
jgi:hypothetical protein